MTTLVEQHPFTLRGPEKLVVSNRRDFLFLAEEVVTKGRSTTIVVDLADTKYIDAAGLGALVQLQQQCRRRGIELELANPQPDVRTLLELTQLDRGFKIRERAR